MIVLLLSFILIFYFAQITKPLIISLIYSFPGVRTSQKGLLLIAILLAASTRTFAQDLLLGITAGNGPNGGGTAFSIKTNGTDFTLLQKFINTGHSPYGDLIQGPDGYFYGMTQKGGILNNGTIFKMTASGKITVIHYFLKENGIHPQGSLAIGNDGNLYGMATDGGANNVGTVFSITPTGKFTLLRSLDFVKDGAKPRGSLVKGNDGDFYGMTYAGGMHEQGTIFKITHSGTYTVLRSLEGYITGGYPSGNLIQGDDGDLYGMAASGNGNDNLGTIFKINSSGLLTVLHKFSTSDGFYPRGSLVKGKDGNFYGMTSTGGFNYAGTIFKITSAGDFTIIIHLDSFTGGNPSGNLTLGDDGNLYGMTKFSGYQGYYAKGTIFKITPTGEFSVLHYFTGVSDGAKPYGSLLKSQDGYFYGMTSLEENNSGSIFKISASGNYTNLKFLPDKTKVNYPQENLIQAKDGFYYGTTNNGGDFGYGTVFKICADGSYQTFYSFVEPTGGRPLGSLIQAKDGNFYGTTASGGKNGWGTVYRLSTTGQITVLHHLNTAVTGYHAHNLVQASDGNFYGMTNYGGVKGFGTIYRITPSGIFTILRDLEPTGGTIPQGNLIQGKDGDLYGLASSGGNFGFGTIFKISLTGNFTILRHLDKSIDGGQPQGSLMQAADGAFYGLTTQGGTNNYGTVFKISSSGDFAVIQNLDFIITGSRTTGSLIQAADGTFYGINSRGGKFAGGTIFEMTPTGTITVLRHLNPPIDGDFPMGNLILQKANPIANAQSVTTTMNTAKAITLTGSGGSPLVYTVVTKPKYGTLTGSGSNRTYTPNPDFNGTDSFSFRVTWGCQESSTKTVSISVTGTAASTVRLNSGGPATSTSLGNFSADAYLTGSTGVYSNVVPIDGTTSDVLYQDYRRAANTGGSFGYSIPLPNGTYTIKLHFAEIFHTTTGKRKFNVVLEGTGWLSNYDIVAAAGGAKKAITATKTITVSDGTISINFTSVVDRACVSAIQIIPVSSGARLAFEQETEETKELSPSLYPNPVKDKLTVQLSQPTKKVATAVTNGTGAQILQNAHQLIAADKLEANVTQLPAGLYLLQLQTDQGYQTLKFIKE